MAEREPTITRLNMSRKAELAALLREVPVRDGLAAERTVLAGERTLLAYVRTAFALVATGLAGAHFLGGTLAIVAAIVGGLGIVLFVIGGARFRKTQSSIVELLRRLAAEG